MFRYQFHDFVIRQSVIAVRDARKRRWDGGSESVKRDKYIASSGEGTDIRYDLWIKELSRLDTYRQKTAMSDYQKKIIQGESFSRSFQKKHPINPIEEAAKKKDIFQK